MKESIEVLRDVTRGRVTFDGSAAQTLVRSAPARFDEAAADRALAAVDLGPCFAGSTLETVGFVTVTFGSRGNATKVDASGILGLASVLECVVSKVAAVTLLPFTDGPFEVRKSFSVRGDKVTWAGSSRVQGPSVVRAVPGVSSASPRRMCDPPYTLDAQGRKRYTIECLP